MLPDHYATLGVAPNAGRAAIRAAYLELMRRFHPDRNPSAAAAARVRAITAAYSVLGVPAQRARYDLELARAGARAAMAPPFVPDGPHSRLTPWLAVAVGIAAILVLVPLLVPPPLVPAERPDRIGGVRAAAAAPQAQIGPAAGLNPTVLCSSAAASALIRRELFRGGARLRGSHLAAFDRIAGFSLLRFAAPPVGNGNPESGTINCRASVAVDLPPGIVAQGGQRSMTGEIGYALRAGSADRGASISLTNGGQIVRLLATLARASTQAAAPADGPMPAPTPLSNAQPQLAQWAPPAAPAPAAAPVRAQPQRLPAAARVEPQRRVVQQNPSFSCSVARSWAAASVCRSASLAALDRQVASLYGDSMARADASKRALLARSDRLFLGRRDGCSSDACVHGAYSAQIREIQQIMAGQPPSR